MRELKAPDKITQKMTRDGAVSENLATGEVEHISSREPETELSASSEESAGAAADLALRAAEHHEKKSARKAEKADTPQESTSTGVFGTSMSARLILGLK